MGTHIISIALLLATNEIVIVSIENKWNITDKFKVGRIFGRFILCVNPTSEHLIYSDSVDKGEVSVYNIKRKTKSSFQAHIRPVIVMTASTDGKMLATASCNVIMIKRVI